MQHDIEQPAHTSLYIQAGIQTINIVIGPGCSRYQLRLLTAATDDTDTLCFFGQQQAPIGQRLDREWQWIEVADNRFQAEIM